MHREKDVPEFPSFMNLEDLVTSVKTERQAKARIRKQILLPKIRKFVSLVILGGARF